MCDVFTHADIIQERIAVLGQSGLLCEVPPENSLSMMLLCPEGPKQEVSAPFYYRQKESFLYEKLSFLVYPFGKSKEK